MLFKDSFAKIFVFNIKFFWQNRDSFLGLIFRPNVKVKTKAVCHHQLFPCLLASSFRYVEEQELHLFAEMCEDFVDFLHGNVEGDDLVGVDDPRHLDLDSLVRDGDLVLWKDFVVADSDGSTGQRTPVALSVHNVGIGQHPIA